MMVRPLVLVVSWRYEDVCLCLVKQDRFLKTFRINLFFSAKGKSIRVLNQNKIKQSYYHKLHI